MIHFVHHFIIDSFLTGTLEKRAGILKLLVIFIIFILSVRLWRSLRVNSTVNCFNYQPFTLVGVFCLCICWFCPSSTMWTLCHMFHLCCTQTLETWYYLSSSAWQRYIFWPNDPYGCSAEPGPVCWPYCECNSLFRVEFYVPAFEYWEETLVAWQDSFISFFCLLVEMSLSWGNGFITRPENP